jgi:MerR family copper efflux transcriptional regulator
MAMSSQGLSISQAARKLGVSARTVRRYIKSGKIEAELIDGQFGQEYCILELPPELYQASPKAETATPGQPPGQTLGQAIDIIRELQEKNLTLAAQLGAATERIRNLENQVKLLTAARMPWWKRLFFRRAG